MKEMRVASIAFAAYFVSSAERSSMNRIGAHEVVDRRALLQELGVRDDVERVLRRLAQDLGDLLRAADRDGALVHDDRVAGHVPADLLGRGENVGEIGLAVLVGGRADRDERDVDAGDRLGVGRREGEPPLLHVATDELFEPRLVDRDPARPEHLDLASVHVEAADLVPGLGEAGARDEPHVARSDDGDLHVPTPEGGRQSSTWKPRDLDAPPA
jgi:hypothetical protein